jgi:KDO2-lipid IV(A) lauroyltransferase
LKEKQPTIWLNLRHRLEFLIFRLIAAPLQMLTARMTARWAELTASFIFHVLPRKITRHKVARENIRIAFGDRYTDQQIDVIIYRMWVHLFRMIAEILQIPRKLHRDSYNDVFVFSKRKDVVRAICSDRPVLVLSGHYGNWEMSVAVLGVFGFHMSVVARALDNPYFDEWFEGFRRHTGHRMVNKKGAFKQMEAVMEEKGNVALLCDQDAGSRGTFAKFFGKDASTFPTIARLAIDHDAFISVGYSRRLPDDFDNQYWVRFELGSEEVVDPRDFSGTREERITAITQQFTSALERAVCLSPEQYFWVHRRWKTQPDVEGSLKAA